MSFAIFAMAAAYPVTTREQLVAAVTRAKGGDVIVLTEGDYGLLQFNNAQFETDVIIRSKDPKRPARIAGLKMQAPRNVVFEDIEFTRVRGNDPAWAKIIDIDGGYNLTIRGGCIHGALNGSPADDINGIFVRDIHRLKITGVSFRELNNALIIGNSANVIIDGNSFSYMAADGMDIPGVNGVVIANNHFYDFRTTDGAHPDAIQCWTRNQAAACKNVSIRHNNFDAAPGHEFQGVFFGDEAKIGGYDNIEIADNVFTSTMWHAIYLGAGSNIVIKNNVITAGPTMKPWIRTESPATLVGNSAPTYVIGGVQKPPRGNKIGGFYKK